MRVREMFKHERGRDKKKKRLLYTMPSVLTFFSFNTFIQMPSLDSQTAEDPENEPILSLLWQEEMVLN